SLLRGAFCPLRRGTLFSPSAFSQIIWEDYGRQSKRADEMDRYELLTNREREILQLVAEGKTTKDIANMLYLSIHTVETHRRHLMEKLDLHSKAEIISYAMRKGIIH